MHSCYSSNSFIIDRIVAIYSRSAKSGGENYGWLYVYKLMGFEVCIGEIHHVHFISG